MKNLLLSLLSLFFAINIHAFNVSGVATNSETGEPLSGFDILLTYPAGGIASEAVTGTDGSFTLTDVADGSYGLEFYTYPDPIILNGDYFVRTIYNNQISVSGGNITGIEFHIPPHHPDYILTGTLYDAVTNEPITIQDFEVQMKMQYLVKHFYDPATENGTYIIEGLPDYTYEFTLFENDYYEGATAEITIDPTDSDTTHMDFYLQPKSGVTVSGVLLDSTTGQPIMRAGRSIQIQAINSMFTETNSQGEFTFINVPPGIYAGIRVTSQDTAFVNTSQSEITGFNVPAEGLSNVELYQKPWISIHEVTADGLTFEPGETKTVKFTIVNDDLSYGGIWGVNLIFPEGVTVLNTTPFYSSANNNELIFDELPDCSSDVIKEWEGWHYTNPQPYATSEGNLEVLNETAWSDVTLKFDNDTSMETAPVFYEIFYDVHCFSIQPFSYGTIMMQNENVFLGENESKALDNQVISYPNPAGDRVNIRVTLDKTRQGKIILYDFSGRKVMNIDPKIYQEGITNTRINTSSLNSGIYYYTFLADDLKLTGKLVISR